MGILTTIKNIFVGSSGRAGVEPARLGMRGHSLDVNPAQPRVVLRCLGRCATIQRVLAYEDVSRARREGFRSEMKRRIKVLHNSGYPDVDGDSNYSKLLVEFGEN